MLSTRTTGSNSNNHKRQWSEGVVSTDKTTRLYKDDDRHLILHLVNEYLLEGSTDVLDLIRKCPNECFEALVDFIWSTASQTTDSHEDDLVIYNQRSSLLSSVSTNVHRQGARRRLAIIFIETFKLLSTPPIHGGRFDIQRHPRLLFFPSQIRQLIHYEPDLHGLSCLTLASMILINPLVVHHQIQLLMDALKHAANQFVQANLSFETTSTFAVSIYSLFYLLYILYPNHLRRELQPESAQTMTSTDRPISRLGIDKVLLPLFSHFKLQPNVVFGSLESEKQEARWQNESWQQLIGNGDRYVVSDDMSPLLSNDFKKRRDEEMKKSVDSNRFDIDQIIRMCNEHAESVLSSSDNRSQTPEEPTTKANPGKHSSTDCYSDYSDSYCQTYDQQWQTTIQNGQINLSRVQLPDESHLLQTPQPNGTSTRKESHSTTVDHNIHAKVQLQLDMLDCNYEQDKREYYAQLIRDLKKAIPINDLDKELRNQEILYDELLITREQNCPKIAEVHKRITGFHHMNEAFYNSLSTTQVELKTDEHNHWQQQSLLNEKETKLNGEYQELEKARVSVENDIREIQRGLFESKQEANQSTELCDLIKQLSTELMCSRKKHQLLHNALMHVKLRSIDAENIVVVHQNDDEPTMTFEDKRKKFDEYKQRLDKQQVELAGKRLHFHQTRSRNTHKIGVIRRQMDTVRTCQTQLITMNSKSQMIDK